MLKMPQNVKSDSLRAIRCRAHVRAGRQGASALAGFGKRPFDRPRIEGNVARVDFVARNHLAKHAHKALMRKVGLAGRMVRPRSGEYFPLHLGQQPVEVALERAGTVEVSHGTAFLGVRWRERQRRRPQW